MAGSVARGNGSDNAPPGLIDQHAVNRGLHAAELGADLLAQASIVAQGLRLDALHHLASPLDEGVEVWVGPDTQLAKTLKELAEVIDGTVPEDLLLAAGAGKPLGQMLDQLAKLAEECLLGQRHGLLKARGDAGPL